jgi:hypothetical protein
MIASSIQPLRNKMMWFTELRSPQVQRRQQRIGVTLNGALLADDLYAQPVSVWIE